MDLVTRLESVARRVAAFSRTRPVMIGAPTALTIGLVAGLAMRVGPQDEPRAEMWPVADRPAELAEPIGWPSGSVPDYVVGTDFAAPRTPQRPPTYDDLPQLVPASLSAPLTEAAPSPEQSGADTSAVERLWASTGGDILDRRLPGDEPVEPAAPLVEAPRPGA